MRKKILPPAFLILFLLLLSCCSKKEEKYFPDQRSDECKETRKEFKSLIEMPFDFSDTCGSFPVSLMKQMETKGYRYTLNQDDDIDKTVGGYTFSVYGYVREDSDFKNVVCIRITKKDFHVRYHWYHDEDAICNWYHNFCPPDISERLRFIHTLTATYGRPQEIWIDSEDVNFDYWSYRADWLAENYLAQNLFWQLEDRKIFIRKDSVDFVVKIFLQ